MKISSSATWPMIVLSILNRSAARTSKPFSVSVVSGSGNQVLYLLAKARALKRAAFRSGVKAL
jgi:hypothetical protein